MMLCMEVVLFVGGSGMGGCEWVVGWLSCDEGEGLGRCGRRGWVVRWVKWEEGMSICIVERDYYYSVVVLLWIGDRVDIF